MGVFTQSGIVRIRERAIRILCGGHHYCVGLSRVGGPDCPVPINGLKISDIQVGHIRKDGLRSTPLYKKILVLKEPWKLYLPLCSVCNQRMRTLKDELRKHSKSFRRKAAKFSSVNGGPKAAKKFGIDRSTLLRWRVEFGFSKFIARKYPACPKYGSHVFNAHDICSGCGYK